MRASSVSQGEIVAMTVVANRITNRASNMRKAPEHANQDIFSSPQSSVRRASRSPFEWRA